jgi:hypothetical protein
MQNLEVRAKNTASKVRAKNTASKTHSKKKRKKKAEQPERFPFAERLLSEIKRFRKFRAISA